MKPSRKLEKSHTNLALETCNVGLQLDKANARIAELTTEVADLRSKLDFANAMNADQDKTVAELTADLKVADRASLELAAEVARYKDAIERIVENVDTSTNVQAYAQFCAYIARNALKEGV